MKVTLLLAVLPMAFAGRLIRGLQSERLSSDAPSNAPSGSSLPSLEPSFAPSLLPSGSSMPSTEPSVQPSLFPSGSSLPSSEPSLTPSNLPSGSSLPSGEPSMSGGESPVVPPVAPIAPVAPPAFSPTLSPTRDCVAFNEDCDSHDECCTNYCLKQRSAITGSCRAPPGGQTMAMAGLSLGGQLGGAGGRSSGTGAM